MTIYFWRSTDNTLKYKHLEVVDNKKLHKVVDYFIGCKYNVMIYNGTNGLVLYLDKGRFGQS